MGCRSRVASCGLRVAGCGLRVASCAGFSAAASLKSGQSNRERNFGLVLQINVVSYEMSDRKQGQRRIIAQQGIECMNRNRGGGGETIATHTWRNSKCKNLNF